MENNPNRKILTDTDLNRLTTLYSGCHLPFFPAIISTAKIEQGNLVEFEWLTGEQIKNCDLPQAFYLLGKLHRLNDLQKLNKGFRTVLHGDIHAGNIIQTAAGIRFIDVTYMHIGWNYTDLFYLDLFNLYDSGQYPWEIKNSDCFAAYHDGCKIKVSKSAEHKLKKYLTFRKLEHYIQNGEKSGTDYTYEKKLLPAFQF